MRGGEGNTGKKRGKERGEGGRRGGRSYTYFLQINHCLMVNLIAATVLLLTVNFNLLLAKNIYTIVKLCYIFRICILSAISSKIFV